MKFLTFSAAVQAGLSLFASSALATPVERPTVPKPAFFLAGDSTTAINGGERPTFHTGSLKQQLRDKNYLVALAKQTTVFRLGRRISGHSGQWIYRHQLRP